MGEDSIPELKDHFGKCGYGYGHWLEVPLLEGEFPEAADPGRRDVAPLRLISWLNN